MRFPAKQYLNHYYTEIEAENDKLISFYAKIKDRVPLNSKHLEIACGPTIYQMVSIVSRVSEIIYTDRSIGALKQVDLWRKKAKNAFDWQKFVTSSLKYEGVESINGHLATREDEIRKKLKKIIMRDLSLPETYMKLGKRYGPFQSIASNFGLEAIVFEKKKFEEIARAIYDILDSKGVLNIIMVEECKAYQINKQYLNTLHITRKDLWRILESVGFKKKNILFDFQETENEEYGYKGIMFFSCIKD